MFWAWAGNHLRDGDEDDKDDDMTRAMHSRINKHIFTVGNKQAVISDNIWLVQDTGGGGLVVDGMWLI